MLMKSSKILTLAVAFAILASVMTPLLGVGPVANAAADEPVEVKIGFLNPITGPIAVYAPGFTIASQIAIGYMNTIQPLNFQFSIILRFVQ